MPAWKKGVRLGAACSKKLRSTTDCPEESSGTEDRLPGKDSEINDGLPESGPGVEPPEITKKDKKIGENMTEKEYWYWLMSREELGPVSVRRLVAANGSASAVWDGDWSCLKPAQAAALQQSKADPGAIQKSYEKMLQQEIRLITEDEDCFPDKLRRIPQPPAALFLRGRDVDPDRPAVAMVGARSATPHGSGFAERLAAELAETGITVVSGFALGIDGASHRGALNGGGLTIGVMGCGIDVCYPAYHAKLYREILNTGTFISEYAPGAPGLPKHFVVRNRLISGLSDAVIVVEARKKSGSLITAEYALSQGRDVMAVPGRPDDALSEGTNRLIKDGAACCTCAQDVLDLLRIPIKREEIPAKREALRGDAKKVADLLKSGPLHTDALAKQTGIPVEKLLQILLSLELEGRVAAGAAGLYSLK